MAEEGEEKGKMDGEQQDTFAPLPSSFNPVAAPRKRSPAIRRMTAVRHLSRMTEIESLEREATREFLLRFLY